MSKYAPLAKRLSDHSGQEWRASFDEIEKVLGFPLPKAALGRGGWWESPGEKAPARTWTDHGWQAKADPEARTVTFRRVAALETHEPEPGTALVAVPRPSAKSWGITAAIAGVAAVGIAVGAVVVRGLMNRAKSELPPPS